VHVSLTLSALGLRESVIPYTEQLSLYVVSDTGAQIELLDVVLTVQAATSFIVWGEVQVGKLCQTESWNSSWMHDLDLDALPIVVEFTACDIDALPVRQSLPTLTDQRQFVTSVATSTLGGVPGNESSRWPQTVNYVGEGHYAIQLEFNSRGPFILNVDLGGIIYMQHGASHCGTGKMPIPNGLCGCPAGKEPSNRACLACEEGKQKLEVGNQLCQDEPFQWWPFAVSSLTTVVGVFLLFWIHFLFDRQRRRLEKRLETDFLAIT
jgi:hypothetical protein